MNSIWESENHLKQYIEFNARLMKTMKIMAFHMIIMKMMQQHRIPFENLENHINIIIPNENKNIEFYEFQ